MSEKRTNLKDKNREAQRRHRIRKKAEAQALEIERSQLEADLARVEQRKLVTEAEIRLLQRSERPFDARPRFAAYLEDVAVDFVPSQSWAGFDPAGGRGVVLVSVYDTPKRLTRELVQRMTVRDLGRFLKELLLTAGQLALEVPQRDPESPPAKKLQAIVKECQGLFSCIACWNPMLYMQSQCANLEDPEQPVLPPGSVDRELLDRLQLSPEQRRLFSRMWLEYSKRVAEVLAERRQLQDAVVHETGVYSPFHSPTYRRSVQLLYRNLVADLIAHDVVWRMLFGHAGGLDCFQSISFILANWPHSPDPTALLEAVWQADGRPGPQDLGGVVPYAPATPPPAPGGEAAAATDLEAYLWKPEQHMVREMIRAYVDCHVLEHLSGIQLSKAFANIKLEPP